MSLEISVRNGCGRSLERSGSIRTDVAFHSPHRTTEIPSKKFDWMYRAWVYSLGFASRVEWCFSGRTHNLIIWWFTTQASDDVLLDHKSCGQTKSTDSYLRGAKNFWFVQMCRHGEVYERLVSEKDLESRKRIMKRAYGNLEIFPCFFYFSHFRLSFSSINFLGFSVLSADLRNRLKPGYVGALWNNLTILLAIFRVEVLSSNIVTLQNKKKSWPVWFRPPHKVSPPSPRIAMIVPCCFISLHETKLSIVPFIWFYRKSVM